MKLDLLIAGENKQLDVCEDMTGMGNEVGLLSSDTDGLLTGKI